MSTFRAFLPACCAIAALGAGPAPENGSIRASVMRADLHFLAGDAFRGRATATPENELANEFVASRFDRLGLKTVVKDGSFFFKYHLVSVRPGMPGALEVARGDLIRRFAQGTDFYPHRFSVSGSARGPLTFAGFGIVAPELGRDDYKGLDVNGRIVLVLDHEPGENDPQSPFDGVVRSEHADPLQKALDAQKRGAVAVLIVADAHNHPGLENFEALSAEALPAEPPRLERYLLEDRMNRLHIPVAQISQAVAAELLGGKGRSLELLGRASESADFRGFLIGQEVVTLACDLRRHVIPDRSVLAVLEGSDPKLKEEYVIVSSHVDHMGTEGNVIMNGADDNGSGTVATIAIAEAFAKAAEAGNRPRRSILFAVFNSEERGLLGSRAFVERPPVPLDRIVAVLNMDMIGRDEEVTPNAGTRFRGLPVQTAESNRDSLTLLGQSRSAALTALIERANAEGKFGLRIKKDYDNNPSNLIRRSDHWPFLQHGVPGVWFHTGLHPDYHTANDRPENIRYDKMERIARLIHQASWDLAREDDRPRLDGPRAR